MKKFSIKKCLTVCGILVVFLTVAGAIVFLEINKPVESRVVLIKEDSWFDGFSEKDGKIYLRCTITLENRDKKDHTVRMSLYMPYEKRKGLIKNATVPSEKEYVIPANSTLEYEKVRFIGDYAGTLRKRDRNLPKVTIEVIE